MKRETTPIKSLSTKGLDSQQMPKLETAKSAQELGITDEQWVNLAESLLISREITSLITSGPLYELHKMQLEYLERYFGIQQNPSKLNPQEFNQE